MVFVYLCLGSGGAGKRGSVLCDCRPTRLSKFEAQQQCTLNYFFVSFPFLRHFSISHDTRFFPLEFRRFRATFKI